jgi:predicted DNA-binding protein YlxM (UPF0122 family)
MDPGRLLGSLSGLWIVVLLLLIIWAGIFGLVKFWQGQIQKEFKRVAPALIRIQAETKRIFEGTRPYSADDPPPYGPLVSGVNQILDQNANELVILKSSFIDLRNRYNRYHFRNWKQFIGAPFYWYTWFAIKRDAKLLNARIDSREQSLSAAWNIIDEIRRQGWLVALEARDMLETERSVRSYMEYLGDQRFVGDRFELAAAQEEIVIDALDQIPRYFFISDETAISSQASKENVSAVFDHLQRVKSTLNKLHTELSAWKEEHQKLELIIGQMREQVSRTSQLLDLLPDGIQRESEAAQLQSMQTIATNLAATLQRLEVESIPLVADEARRIEQAAILIGNTIRRGLRQHNALAALMAQIKLSQEEISGIITDKAKLPAHPLNWDRTRGEFREINKQVSLLGKADQSRTLEQIDIDLDLANGLSIRIQDLLSACKETARKHEALTELLDSESTLSIPEWCQDAVRLGGEVAMYHPDNWLKLDRADTFMEDVHFLAGRYQNDVPVEASKSIKESELPGFLANLQGMVDEQKRLYDRAEKIQVRLSWLQGIEESTRETLQSTRNIFHQLAWIVNSNEFLIKTARSEIDQFRSVLDKLILELNQRHIGLVEKKARAAKSWLEEVESASNRWLAQLNQDIRQRREEFAVRLSKLNEVAVLDDPAIERVKQLLSKDVLPNSAESGKPIFHLTLEESIAELGERSHYWQECVAVHRELEEIVEAPLFDAVRHAEAQRQSMHNRYSQAQRRLTGQRSWPPSSVSLADEGREVESLEQEWREVKSQQGRAIWAVRRYSDLAAKYQSVETRLDQALQWSSQEQRRIIDLEKEIGRMLRENQLKENTLGNQPIEAERLIRVRLQATRAVEAVRSDWIAGSSAGTVGITYDEVYNRLMKVVQLLQETSHSAREALAGSDMPAVE